MALRPCLSTGLPFRWCVYWIDSIIFELKCYGIGYLSYPVSSSLARVVDRVRVVETVQQLIKLFFQIVTLVLGTGRGGRREGRKG